MNNKAGIDTTKVYCGLASYGRSYQITDKNCKTYGCGFSGPNSPAPSGPITNISVFLSINEIYKLTFSETNFNATSIFFM